MNLKRIKTIRRIAFLKDMREEWKHNGIRMERVRLTRWQDRDEVRPQIAEIRSRKHSAVALGTDDLYVYALMPNGRTVQLIPGRECSDFFDGKLVPA